MVPSSKSSGKLRNPRVQQESDPFCDYKTLEWIAF
jgi:hypothetical protein